MPCLAQRHSDQMQCTHCGLAWDVNDPEPSKCRPDKRLKVTKEALAALTPKPAKLPALPDMLPFDVVADMERAYQANAGRGRYSSMQAAYRVLLDRIAP